MAEIFQTRPMMKYENRIIHTASEAKALQLCEATLQFPPYLVLYSRLEVLRRPNRQAPPPPCLKLRLDLINSLLNVDLHIIRQPQRRAPRTPLTSCSRRRSPVSFVELLLQVGLTWRGEEAEASHGADDAVEVHA